MAKQRVDELLVQQAHFTSVKQAQRAIMAGLVFSGTERIETAGTMLPAETMLTVKGTEHPYVSRGGLKLEKAIRTFSIEMTDKVMIDVGASTGGFTDCALRHGASYVYAVDVGYNQLAWSLRSLPQVQVMERTNFRYVQQEAFSDPRPNMATIDVSFISLTKIFPPLYPLLASDSEVIALIKPQFEAAREEVGPSGVVDDPAIHEAVLTRILSFVADLGFTLQGLTHSPITGGAGNIEYLAYWHWGHRDDTSVLNDDLEAHIATTVTAAHHTHKE